MNPEGAVRAFLELKRSPGPNALRLVPISYEPLEEPLYRLGAAVRQHHIESMVS